MRVFVEGAKQRQLILKPFGDYCGGLLLELGYPN